MIESKPRYHSLSVALHWVLAVLIIGLLTMGKYMVSLEESDSLRFSLTQWHKSFGVTVLILVFLRILWRLIHRPPPLPADMPSWEKLASSLTHITLYLLIAAIPLSGWIMVSASPLSIPTIVFNTYSWPHFPFFESSPNKESVANLFIFVHDILGIVLIALLVAHIGAALRHRFIFRDGIMARMSIFSPEGKMDTGVILFFGAPIVLIAAFIIYGYAIDKPAPIGATKSHVGFTFNVLGGKSTGTFAASSVDLKLNPADLAGSSIRASVDIASVSTGNKQVDAALPKTEWFNTEAYPKATFVSSQFQLVDEKQYLVTGVLELKGVTRELSFPLDISDEDGVRTAKGSFSLNRVDHNVGSTAEPSDKTVGYDVKIEFALDLD